MGIEYGNDRFSRGSRFAESRQDRLGNLCVNANPGITCNMTQSPWRRNIAEMLVAEAPNSKAIQCIAVLCGVKEVRYLFDPDRYPFLEGRTAECRDDEPAIAPRISDGVVYRVLRNLLILDGERLSYRTLDVEQIGSVYETMMGFDLETAQGKSIAIKPVKSYGAPATVNLDGLLETPGKDRAKWIKEHTDQKITGEALKSLKSAESIDDLLAALDKKIHKTVTPRVVSAGAIVLQPSDERRRSGSHYTLRSLTEPIVETTLQPILRQLVEPPKECGSDIAVSRWRRN